MKKVIIKTNYVYSLTLLATIGMLIAVVFLVIVPKQKTKKPMDVMASMKEILRRTAKAKEAETVKVAPPTIFDKFKRLKTLKKSGGIKKNPVEIFGPLRERKIISAYLPVSPEWAKNKEVKADVTLRFYVTPRGKVVEDNITVEGTSGYGDMDKLAIKALKKWIFGPTSSNRRRYQWGLITFKFKEEKK